MSTLLNAFLYTNLPKFNQSDPRDPIIWARFYLEHADSSWWIAEGEAEGPIYTFYCVEQTPHGMEWKYRTLNYLEATTGPFGRFVLRDEKFTPRPLCCVPELRDLIKIEEPLSV